MHIDYKLDDSRNKGLIVSAIIHAVLFLLFFFLLVWQQPDPPTPGSPGIELNFGLDAAGMGPNNDQPISENSTEPIQEEVQDQSQPTPSEEASAVTSDMETDYRLEDKKDKNPVKTETKEPLKEVKKSPEEVKETKTQQSTKTTKSTDGRSLMGNGDKNTAGDQGDPKGSLDARALYGNNGEGNGGNGKGGNGTSLNMTGWKWLSPPRVNDNSSESGKLVFKITVDEDGNIVAVIPVEKQVSSSVAKFYEDAVWKLEFEKTKDFTKAAQNSTGFITFIIRSK